MLTELSNFESCGYIIVQKNVEEEKNMLEKSLASIIIEQ